MPFNSRAWARTRFTQPKVDNYTNSFNYFNVPFGIKLILLCSLAFFFFLSYLFYKIIDFFFFFLISKMQLSFTNMVQSQTWVFDLRWVEIEFYYGFTTGDLKDLDPL